MRMLAEGDVQLTNTTLGTGGRYTVYEARMHGVFVVAKTATHHHSVDLLEVKADLIAEHRTLSMLDHQAIPRTGFFFC